ncbi:hypothetical protein PMIN06_004488 [Paraphaeosphaeria minitans]
MAPSSQDLVLFIPYLHWDFNRSEPQPNGDLGSHKYPTSLATTEHEELKRVYLSKSHHSLHVRRTLSYYYHYHSTDAADTHNLNQVASIFQTNKRLPVNIVSMVDQLWLWVLKDEPGTPEIVISCFPNVQNGPKTIDHADRYDRTDVLENIKRYLLRNPGIITCAYDLSGIIAAKFSHNYFNSSSTLDFSKLHKDIQISEMYEEVIRDLTQKESAAFELFRSKLRSKHDKDEIAEITSEIQLMSQAKLVLDELNMMKFLFETQKKEFRYLRDKLPPTDSGSGILSHPPETTANEENHTVTADLRGMDVKAGNNLVSDLNGQKVGGVEDSVCSPNVDSVQASNDVGDDYDAHLGRTTTNYSRSFLNWRPRDVRLGAIWTQRRDGLLLNYVYRSIEDINGMMDRTNRAYKSLNALVDLKLKHNTVIESRKTLNLTHSINESTAQTQSSIEQTTKLAEKADKEGSTILVFTIVTIIFLPMSFMATMFQIDIRQYKKSGGQLDLGYVAAIIFPISISISALLIWAALKASYVERILSRIYGKSDFHAVERAVTTSYAASTLAAAPAQRQLKELKEV